jgi:hypothetical protein
MLTKNPFAKPTPAPPAAGSSAQAAEAKVKGAQLLKGRTRAMVERLTEQVQDAQHARENAKRAAGELVSEGQDATAAMREMRQAHDRLDALEAALAVAIQKDGAAQADLKKAEHQVLIEAEAAACEHVLALGPRFEEVSALVRQFALDMARETEALRVAGGDDKYAYPVSQIRAQFEFFLRLASHPRTTDFPSALKMYESFTACLVAICGMRSQP